MSHRDPPLPEDFWKVPAGACRWCREPTLFPERHKRAGEVNRRRNWHEECARLYRIAAFSEDQRRHVDKADGGCCRACGRNVHRAVGYREIPARPQNRWRPWDERPSYESYFQRRKIPDDWVEFSPVEPVFTAWQADHIVPLWSVDRDAPDALRFWLAGNLQLLCGDCHKAKSAREAADRARLARVPAGTPDMFGNAA